MVRQWNCITLRARSAGGRSVQGTANGIVPGSWTPAMDNWASASSSSVEGSRSSSRGVRSRSPYSGQWVTFIPQIVEAAADGRT